jgi:hypothetical protein
VNQDTFGDNWDQVSGDPRARDDAQAEDEAFDRVQQRIDRETQALRRMRDPRTEAEKQQAAWLKDEYYDLNEDTDGS